MCQQDRRPAATQGLQLNGYCSQSEQDVMSIKPGPAPAFLFHKYASDIVKMPCMPLTEQQTESFRQQLLQKQQTIMQLEDTVNDASKTVELDQTSVGRLSRMDAMQGQAMSQELQRRQQLELQQIMSALKRIDSGDYGYCVDCDEDIAIGRLQLDPATPLCIRCASRRESGA